MVQKNRASPLKVVGFCGLPGSGKSRAIDAIVGLGPVITMGDVIRNEAKKRNIEPTGENLGKIAKELREKGGQKVVADKCVDLIKAQNSDIIFVDGLRSMAEVNAFRREWKFPIIAIDLNEEERFKRLLLRGRSDDPKTIEELKERDKREMSLGITEVINKADYVILNDISVKKLQKKTKKLVKKIIKNY